MQTMQTNDLEITFNFSFSRFAAARIIENMDPAADPCDDFFQYACGGWLQSNEIPEEDSSFGTLDGISEEVDKAVKGE